MGRNANLSIFVPHAGCPNQCVFCNQRRIAGQERAPTAAEVAALCDRYLPPCGETIEIAFFGGSFTAIDRDLMEQLLAAALPFVQAGRAAGIRVSTRPDAIDAAVLKLLKRYGVTAVELGAQSMDDAVLAANRRGHTARQVAGAARLIKDEGFALGLQMMVGMYGERDATDGAFKTAKSFLRLRPDTVRIYPTVVIKDTELCGLYEAGLYVPLNVAQAVEIVAALLPMFEQAGIGVIRVGLHADEALAKSIVAGPYHPAFGEQCYSRVMRDVIEAAIARADKREQYAVMVNSREVSRAVGYQRGNLRYFEAQGRHVTVAADDKIDIGNVCIK